MPFATSDDVQVRLSRSLSDPDWDWVDALLEDATALVIGYLGTDLEPGPYPQAAVSVTAQMVARVLSTPVAAGIESQTTGPFAVSYSSGVQSGGPWLSQSDRQTLRALRGGSTSTSVVSERTADAGTS